MKKIIIAVVESVRPVPSKKTLRCLLGAAFAGIIVSCGPSALAAPDIGITNGGVVLFQGNQSLGVTFPASASGPTTMIVSNLSSSIDPFPGTVGVQIGGSVNSQILTAIIDTNVTISTLGNGAARMCAVSPKTSFPAPHNALSAKLP